MLYTVCVSWILRAKVLEGTRRLCQKEYKDVAHLRPHPTTPLVTAKLNIVKLSQLMRNAKCS